MPLTVTDFGEIGAVGGVLRPIDMTLQRDAAAWDLTGYTLPELRSWDARTKTVVALNGTAAVQAPATSGIVRYTPGASDPIHANAGAFEARVWATPSGGGDPEPSNMFRYSIGYGPQHS